MRHRLLSLWFASLLVASSSQHNLSFAQDRVLIEGVPHVRQKNDFCGEACVASWLQKLGLSTDQDAVFDQSGLDPLLARGCYTAELETAIRRLGFQRGAWIIVRTESFARRTHRGADELAA